MYKGERQKVFFYAVFGWIPLILNNKRFYLIVFLKPTFVLCHIKRFVKLLTFNLPPPGPSFLKEIFVSSGGNKNLVLEGEKIASLGGSVRHVLNVKC